MSKRLDTAALALLLAIGCEFAEEGRDHRASHGASFDSSQTARMQDYVAPGAVTDGLGSLTSDISSRAAGSACTLQDAPIRITADLLEEDRIGLDEVHLMIRNNHDQTATITIAPTVLSSVQSEALRRTDPVVVDAGSEVPVTLDLGRSGVLDHPLEVAGHIYLTVYSEFSDGTNETTAGPMVNFHPVDGHIAAYSRLARLQRPDKGHLTLVSQESAAALERQLGEQVLLDPGHAVVGGDPTGADDLRSATRGRHVASRSAANVDVTFCFKQTTHYVDAGVGEDDWTTSSAYARAAIGQNFQIFGPGDAWLGSLSSTGCWSPSGLIPTGTYLAAITSKGTANGWTVDARSLGGGNFTSGTYFIVSASGTITITLGYHDVPNTYMAMAKALTGHGGLSSNKGTARADVGGCSATVYDPGSDQLRICTQPNKPANHLKKKFTIAHELGHLLQERNTGLFPNNYGHNPPGANDCDPLSDGDGHATTSTEFQSSAANEGYASFFAADAWNSHTANADCWISIGMFGAHPCKNGDANKHPLRLMETRCIPGSGLGNETDWARAFWELHTYNAGTVPHNTMLEWMADAEAGATTTNAYEQLSDVAPDWNISGRWTDVSAKNGVDWP